MPKRNDCSLRPMTRDDLELVLRWRNSDRVRENMYKKHVISPDEHLAWFERESVNRKSQLLIFEYRKQPLGVVNFTNIDFENQTCTWGFYIGADDAPRGSGSAMGFLALERIFEQFNIAEVLGEVLSFNEDSLRFHRRLGFEEKTLLSGHKPRSGDTAGVIRLVLSADGWSRIKPELAARFFKSETEPCGK